MRTRIDLKSAMAQAKQPVAAELTLRELVAAYAAVHLDETQMQLRKWLDAFGERSAWEITAAELAHAAEAMMDSGLYQPATVNRNLSFLGTVFKFARARRLAPAGWVSPTLAVPRYPEAPRVVTITAEEIRALLDGAAAFRNRKFAVFVRLLYVTGARKAEIVERRWSDIDLDRGEITVMQTKTDRPRVLFFPPEVADLMRRVWPKPKRDPAALLFDSKRCPGQPETYRRQWSELTALIGRPDLRVHDLRHHRAAELLKAGTTLAVASQVLGHSSLILQRRYGHLETGALRTAARASWEAA